eukprot:1587629-Heterocapsa_arctica.AAC.2
MVTRLHARGLTLDLLNLPLLVERVGLGVVQGVLRVILLLDRVGLVLKLLLLGRPAWESSR